ncbi:MAG TPA: IS1634 family transposase [Ktedonobacteraceae bacterium]|nr:IS1634 family transposase [Ktedonobacteraceae bacterium]
MQPVTRRFPILQYTNKEENDPVPIESCEENDPVPIESCEEGGPVPIAITYGYSRDHREDLKQWMLALGTTHDGDVPIFLRPLDGNSSDKEYLSAAVKEVMKQLGEQLPAEQEQQIVIFDSGGYSQANVSSYNKAKIRWISRVPETSTAAKTALQEEYEQWYPLSDGSGDYVARTMDLPQGKERWIIVRPHARLLAAKKQMDKKVKKAQDKWEKKLWHLSVRSFSCEKDAEEAWKQAIKGKPSWLVATFTLRSEAHYGQAGKPKKDASPKIIVWHLVPTVSTNEPEVEAQIKKDACFIIATNILDEQQHSHEQVITSYKEQGGVERGCAFSQRSPLFRFLHFCQKAGAGGGFEFHHGTGSVSLSLKLSHLLRSRLAQTEETVPNQVNKPTKRPTMRWMFQCFEGIDLLHIRMGSRLQTQVLGLQALHQKVLRLLGPPYAHLYGLPA